MESVGKERWQGGGTIGRFANAFSLRLADWGFLSASRSSTPRQLTANSSLPYTHTTRSVLAWTLTVTKTMTKTNTKTMTKTKTMTTHRYLNELVITKTLTGNSCYIEGQSILDDNSKRSYKLDVFLLRNLLLAEDNNLSLHSNQYSENHFSQNFQINNVIKWVKKWSILWRLCWFCFSEAST